MSTYIAASPAAITSGTVTATAIVRWDRAGMAGRIAVRTDLVERESVPVEIADGVLVLDRDLFGAKYARLTGSRRRPFRTFLACAPNRE